MGLCKLGSSGGTDSSWKPFTDGSTMKLAEACRRLIIVSFTCKKKKKKIINENHLRFHRNLNRFLINPAKDKDMRKWAVEGLSYLTLDAEVKEKLIEDKAALQALIEVAKVLNINWSSFTFSIY